MSFTWKFTKPVSKTTLTSNTSPSYTTNPAAGTYYTWPGDSENPTADILKAQLDELRVNIDSTDNNGKIRCSTHNISYITCSSRRSSYYAEQRGTYYGSQGCSARYTTYCSSVEAGYFGEAVTDNFSSVKSTECSGDCSDCNNVFWSHCLSDDGSNKYATKYGDGSYTYSTHCSTNQSPFNN